MSVRYTQFAKSTLDALAGRANAYFSTTPSGGYASFGPSSATNYDITAGGSSGSIYRDTDGRYYTCTVSCGPDIPLQHADSGGTLDYFEAYDPGWDASFRRVRQLIGRAFSDRATAAAGCGVAQAILEAGVCSGPWPIGHGYFDESGLRVTAGFSRNDSASRPSSFQWCGFKGLELLSYQATGRLDIVARIGGGTVLAGFPDARNEFHLKVGLSRSAYLRGYVQVGIRNAPTGEEVSGYEATGGVFDVYNSSVFWVWGGSYSTTTHEVTLRDDLGDLTTTGIEVGVTVMPGESGCGIESTWNSVIATWPGASGTTASNVISNGVIYRSAAVSPLPVVSWESYYITADPEYAVENYTYADGANCAELYAVPVNYSPDDRNWVVRGKSLPAFGIEVGVVTPDTNEWQQPRASYPCQRLTDTTAHTWSSTENGLQEIRALHATRSLATLDQHRPVLAIDDTAGTREELSAAVGFVRDVGGAGFISLGCSAGIGTRRMWYATVLGQASALIVFDHLSLRWNESKLLMTADGLRAVGVPSALNGWSWDSGAQCLGYQMQAPEVVDDLNDAMDALNAASA